MKTQQCQLASTQDNNGQTAFTKLEIKSNVDHAGLSEPQKLSQTDSVLLQTDQSMLFSLLKIWYHVIMVTWDATEVGQTVLGNTYKTLVLSQMHASHTPLVVVKPQLAEATVKMELNLENTNANRDPLWKPLHPLKLRMKSTNMDQWKLHSQFTVIS